jgi:hypothetical protein
MLCNEFAMVLPMALLNVQVRFFLLLLWRESAA